MKTRNQGCFKTGFYKNLQNFKIPKPNMTQKINNCKKLNKESEKMIKNEINFQILKKLTPRRTIYPLIKIKVLITKNTANFFKEKYDIKGRFSQNEEFEKEFISYKKRNIAEKTVLTARDIKFKLTCFKDFILSTSPDEEIDIERNSILTIQFIRETEVKV